MDHTDDLRLSQLLIAEGEGYKRDGREHGHSEALGAWSNSHRPFWTAEGSNDGRTDAKSERRNVRPVSATGKPPSAKVSQQSRPLSASLFRLPPKARRRDEPKTQTPFVRTHDQTKAGREDVEDDLVVVAEKIGQGYGGVLHVSSDVRSLLERHSIGTKPLCKEELEPSGMYDGVSSPLPWGKRSEQQTNAEFLSDLQNTLSCVPFGTKILKESGTTEVKLSSSEIHADAKDDDRAFVLAGSITPTKGLAPSFAALGSPKAPAQRSRHGKGPETTPLETAPKFLVVTMKNTQRPSSATAANKEQSRSVSLQHNGIAKRPSSATAGKRPSSAQSMKDQRKSMPQVSEVGLRQSRTGDSGLAVKASLNELALSSRKELFNYRRPQSAPLHRRRAASKKTQILQDGEAETVRTSDTQDNDALADPNRHEAQNDIAKMAPIRIQTRPESAPPSRALERDDSALQVIQQRAVQRLEASHKRTRPASAAPKSQLDEAAASLRRPRSAPPKQDTMAKTDVKDAAELDTARRTKFVPAWAVQHAKSEEKVRVAEVKRWNPISRQEDTKLRDASFKARKAMLAALPEAWSVWQDPVRRQKRFALLKQLEENRRSKWGAMDMGGWRVNDIMKDLQTVDAPIIKAKNLVAGRKWVTIPKQENHVSKESRQNSDEGGCDVEMSGTNADPTISHSQRTQTLLSYALHPASAIVKLRPDKQHVKAVRVTDIVEVEQMVEPMVEPAVEEEQPTPSNIPTHRPQFAGDVVEAFADLIRVNREQIEPEDSENMDIKPRKKVVFNDADTANFMPDRMARVVGDGEEKVILRSGTAALSSSQVVHDFEYAHERRGGANSLCGPTTPNFKPYKPEGIELKRWVKDFVTVHYTEESKGISLPCNEESPFRSKEEFVNVPYQIDYILDLSKTAVDISNQGSFSKAIIVIALTVRGGDAKLEARFHNYDPKRKAHWEGSPFFGRPSDVGFEDEAEDFDWMSLITIDPKNDQHYKTARQRTNFLHFIVKGLHGHGQCTLRAAMVRTNAYEEHRAQNGLANAVGKHNPNEVVFKHLLQNQALQQSEIRKRIVRAGGSIDTKLGSLAWHAPSYHAHSDTERTMESRLRDSLARSTVPIPTDPLSLRWHEQQQRRGKRAPRKEEIKREVNFVFKDKQVVAESVPSSSMSNQSIDIDDPERAESDMFDAWANFVVSNNSVHSGERSKVLDLAELFRLLFSMELVGSPDGSKTDMRDMVAGAKIVISHRDVLYVFSKTKRYPGNHDCIDFEGFVSFMRRCSKRTSKTVHQLMHAYRKNQRASAPQSSMVQRAPFQSEVQRQPSTTSAQASVPVEGAAVARTATKDERQHKCWLGNFLPDPSPAELSQFHVPPVATLEEFAKAELGGFDAVARPAADTIGRRRSASFSENEWTRVELLRNRIVQQFRAQEMVEEFSRNSSLGSRPSSLSEVVSRAASGPTSFAAVVKEAGDAAREASAVLI